MAPLNPRRSLLVSLRMRLLRGLTAKTLPCGCVVGVYETYNDGVVATIDVRGPRCAEPDHALHGVVALNPSAQEPPIGVMDL